MVAHLDWQHYIDVIAKLGDDNERASYQRKS